MANVNVFEAIEMGQYTKDELDFLKQDIEWELCKNSPEYFINNYVYFEDKDSEEIATLFTLWPEQTKALKQIHEGKLTIVLKARQLGLTWLVLAYSAWLLLFRPAASVVALSVNENSANEMVRRLNFIFRHFSDNFSTPSERAAKSKRVRTTWDSKLSALFLFREDGEQSTFQSYPAGPNAARGLTTTLVIIDEWASQLYATEIWDSAYPTVSRPGGGKLVGLSTMKKGTLFEALFVNAYEGKGKLTPVFLPWNSDPRRDQEWYNDQLDTLGDSTYAEFPLTVEEAMMVPGGAMFPELKPEIHVCHALEIQPWWRIYVSLDYGYDCTAAIWVAVSELGEAYVFREYVGYDQTVTVAAQAIIEANQGMRVQAWVGPPDLAKRSNDTGVRQYELFSRAGIFLSGTSNDRKTGWLAVRDWILPREVMNNESEVIDKVPLLRMIEGETPELFKCLRAIQRNPKIPGDTMLKPHKLTHLPDALRYWCSSRSRPGQKPNENETEVESKYQNTIKAMGGLVKNQANKFFGRGY